MRAIYAFNFRSATSHGCHRRLDEKVLFKENEAVLLQRWLQLRACVHPAHRFMPSDGSGDDWSTGISRPTTGSHNQL